MNSPSSVNPITNAIAAESKVRVAFGLLLILASWELCARSNPTLTMLISMPSAIGVALSRELHSGAFYNAVAKSLLHVGSGVALGSLLGIAAGIGDVGALPGATLIRTFEVLLRPIPPLACIPFAIILFGSSDLAATFIVAIGVFWTSLIATREALRAVPPELHELAAAYGYRNGPSKLWHIVLPAALPGIFAGFKTAVGQGWTLVVAAELIGIPGSERGSGRLQASSQTRRYSPIWRP